MRLVEFTLTIIYLSCVFVILHLFPFVVVSLCGSCRSLPGYQIVPFMLCIAFTRLVSVFVFSLLSSSVSALSLQSTLLVLVSLITLVLRYIFCSLPLARQVEPTYVNSTKKTLDLVLLGLARDFGSTPLASKRAAAPKSKVSRRSGKGLP